MNTNGNNSIFFIDFAPLPVVCRTERESNPNQIKVGRGYLINKNSIWIDGDGDSYGKVYDLKGNYVGQMLLSHFRCI